MYLHVRDPIVAIKGCDQGIEKKYMNDDKSKAAKVPKVVGRKVGRKNKTPWSRASCWV
jgi:hypothetical protein